MGPLEFEIALSIIQVLCLPFRYVTYIVGVVTEPRLIYTERECDQKNEFYWE